VDHPDTQAAKRQRLRDLPGALPSQVTYVAMDFNRQSLLEALAHAGFDESVRTFFLWEGVTNYLTKEAVNRTAGIHRLEAFGQPRSFLDAGVLRDPSRFPGGRRLARMLQRWDEPWTFELCPAETMAFVAEHGLRLIDHTGSVDYRVRYRGAKGRRLKGYGFYRVAVAETVCALSSAAGAK
jgi:methyltransferase (TIGR00027 family)